MSHHQLTRFVSFYINSLHFNKEHHCNKNGAKRSSSWPGTLFWPISEKTAQGVPKRVENQIITKSGFQHVKRFLIIKEVPLSCLEVKRGPG
jgi:hypothetical protein